MKTTHAYSVMEDQAWRLIYRHQVQALCGATVTPAEISDDSPVTCQKCRTFLLTKIECLPGAQAGSTRIKLIDQCVRLLG